MNAVSETTERVALYYREGSSDKVYQAAIEPAGQQFVVKFAYGRRGATLTTGTKTSSPVDYATAKKIYTKLVREKKAKGYTEGADGTPYQHTDKQASGILPQLLNPIEESEVELLLCDDNYCAQEKFDGGICWCASRTNTLKASIKRDCSSACRRPSRMTSASSPAVSSPMANPSATIITSSTCSN